MPITAQSKSAVRPLALLVCSLLLALHGRVHAQALPPLLSAEAPCAVSHLQVCVKHVAQDEAGILLSPLRAPKAELLWLVPFGAATGIAVHYDTQAIQDLGVNPTREDHFNKLSSYAGLYAPFAAAAVGYGAGTVKGDDYLTETAVLSAEAMADAGIL